MMARHTTPPTLAEIELLAAEAFATIPEELRRHVDNVPIRIEEFPDEETEQEMGLESPFDLLGLYRGVALPRQSVLDVRTRPD
jgi:predicted Zn-dependent protease with MMP-like domain